MSAPRVVVLDAGAFRVIEGPQSGAAMYYNVVEEPPGSRLLRGAYRPGLETVTMGVQVPDELRQRPVRLRWRWRARAFPAGGDECTPGKGDSAASVNIGFKRGLRWYILKYVWSTSGKLGAVCDRTRNLLLARDTIVLESGGEPGTWFTEMVDVRKSFIDHFADGDPNASVPDFVGIGVMTDGDQTRSEASADWTGFELVY